MAIVWRKMIGQRPFDAVIVALEVIAGESPFFPRPYEVLKKITGNQPRQSDVMISTTTRIERLRRKQEEYEDQRKKDIDFYAKIPQEEKEKAAKEIIRNNPTRTKFLVGRSLESPGWRAMILRLLRDGVVDEENEDVDV